MNISNIFKILDWTKVKMSIFTLDSTLFPYKKEIWWASMGYNIGVEMNGKNDKFERPIVVIKVFNTHSLLVAPITTNSKDHKYSISFVNASGEVNFVNISHIRSISSKRLLRKVGSMSDYDYERVMNLLLSSL